MNIGVICNVNSMGDCVVNLKALYALKMLYPRDKIHFIIRKKFAPLFKRLNFIDKLKFIDEMTAGGGDLRFKRFGRAHFGSLIQGRVGDKCRQKRENPAHHLAFS